MAGINEARRADPTKGPSLRADCGIGHIVLALLGYNCGIRVIPFARLIF
jgi:hypothetical protein